MCFGQVLLKGGKTTKDSGPYDARLVAPIAFDNIEMDSWLPHIARFNRFDFFFVSSGDIPQREAELSFWLPYPGRTLKTHACLANCEPHLGGGKIGLLTEAVDGIGVHEETPSDGQWSQFGASLGIGKPKDARERLKELVKEILAGHGSKPSPTNLGEVVKFDPGGFQRSARSVTWNLSTVPPFERWEKFKVLDKSKMEIRAHVTRGFRPHELLHVAFTIEGAVAQVQEPFKSGSAQLYYYNRKLEANSDPDLQRSAETRNWAPIQAGVISVKLVTPHRSSFATLQGSTSIPFDRLDRGQLFGTSYVGRQRRSFRDGIVANVVLPRRSLDDRNYHLEFSRRSNVVSWLARTTATLAGPVIGLWA